MKKTIVLAGGCFWGMEKLYRGLPGILEARVGYANGDAEEHADYRTVCTGRTGFREALQLCYDTERISLRRLLFVFFAVIDPTQFNRQGMDVGTQYQTGIYWSDAETEAEVRAVAEMERAARREFYVELKPLTCFYAAEEYHQRYLEKNPDGYCHISPGKMAAVTGCPYRDADYTRPAAELLAAYRARR
ncbi:MAG: peptide-methionine (S)-S-oxide reductase MsrA [Oscillospiraceae bacterium]|nr:peptide-methionine (S)-S-oxide reductase MsrA [Oscillospiraceae bacterium]